MAAAAAAATSAPGSEDEGGSGSGAPGSEPDWEEELELLLERLGAAERAPGAAASGGCKVVYFVRHAQSMSNHYSHRISLLQPWAACQLCAVGVDSALSEEGRAELGSVRAACQALLPELQAVLHSPLRRAEETAAALFGAEDAAEPGGFLTGGPGDAVPWHSVQCLKEETLEEHAQEPGFNVFAGPRVRKDAYTSSRDLQRRLEGFLSFVWRCPLERFAVVGHSLWFRRDMKFSKSELLIRSSPLCGSSWPGDEVEYMASVLGLITQLPQVTWQLHLTAGESILQVGRNNAVMEFLSTDATHLLFLDADVGFEAETVWGLLAEDRDVALAMYPSKSFNERKMVEALWSTEATAGRRARIQAPRRPPEAARSSAERRALPGGRGWARRVHAHQAQRLRRAQSCVSRYALFDLWLSRWQIGAPRGVVAVLRHDGHR
ncbi:unnamed protein product [Prorocentrum cordatum]|uniref:Uncharacterized protein n=1 Tax=Prorocentrum cordatum TaxID=2364126 RepID=A0ABN9WE88_9DINO|nr:unnamed protein product [Polarella glacialis]